MILLKKNATEQKALSNMFKLASIQCENDEDREACRVMADNIMAERPDDKGDVRLDLSAKEWTYKTSYTALCLMVRRNRMSELTEEAKVYLLECEHYGRRQGGMALVMRDMLRMQNDPETPEMIRKANDKFLNNPPWERIFDKS